VSVAAIRLIVANTEVGRITLSIRAAMEILSRRKKGR
jgi:hypothetical protein